jgi:hypothetical protein
MYHEAATKKSQILFRVGKFHEGKKIFLMQRDQDDHLRPVSMLFSLTASIGTHIHQLADLRNPSASGHI